MGRHVNCGWYLKRNFTCYLASNASSVVGAPDYLISSPWLVNACLRSSNVSKHSALIGQCSFRFWNVSISSNLIGYLLCSLQVKVPETKPYRQLFVFPFLTSAWSDQLLLASHWYCSLFYSLLAWSKRRHSYAQWRASCKVSNWTVNNIHMFVIHSFKNISNLSKNDPRH